MYQKQSVELAPKKRFYAVVITLSPSRKDNIHTGRRTNGCVVLLEGLHKTDVSLNPLHSYIYLNTRYKV